MKNKSEPLDKKISITDLIEKPKKSLNKINYRIVGRYVLPYEIISILKKAKKVSSKEIQLTDALQAFVKNKGRLEGFITNSKIFDCGSKKGFIGANIASVIGDREMKKYIFEILNN